MIEDEILTKMVFKKKAQQGIGSMIIFIALILVAAVAAGVLINTSNSLQSKSLDVGKQSQQRVTTSLEVVSVYAMDGTDHFINSTSTNEGYYSVVRLAPGSNPIKMGDFQIRFNTENTTQMMDYVDGAADDTAFNITSSSGNGDDYLETGETMTLFFQGTRTVGETESVEIVYMPAGGSSMPVEMTTPPTIINKVVSLK